MTIAFGSSQAEEFLARQKVARLLEQQEEAMLRVLEIAKQLEQTGKQLHDLFVDAGYGLDCDIEGFVAESWRFGKENGLLPDEYYAAVRFKSALLEFLKEEEVVE